MSDPALALQGALVVAFKAAATEAGDTVLSVVDPDAPFPRIVLGPGQTVGAYADCYDGSESFLQIDVWDRPGRDGAGLGYAKVKRIASALRDLINAGAFALADHTLELSQVRSTTYSVDPDGVTHRALIAARFLTQPAD